MKTLYALLIAAFCLFSAAPAGAYNVYAPNSWDAAGTDTLEYQTVERLCEEGKSPKYGADYFVNGAHLTRYELAGVMIDLMDNGKDLTNADWVELNKMRRSYRRELDAHGWHAAPKEQKKPLIEISGDLRVRHQSGGNGDGGSDARARLGFTYHVDDHTSIQAGHVAGSDD